MEKYWSFSFTISTSNDYSGLISFRIDWLDLLSVQGTLKSLLQHHSSKASILRWSFNRYQYISRRRQWPPTPVFLPGKSHGWRSLIGCSPWSRTQLSDFTFHFHALEKEMATHSSVFAWRIQGQGSLVGCRLWGHTESDTTEAT